MKTATAYVVTICDQNSWFADGTRVILDRCEHEHRTLDGAGKCLARLQRRNSEGMTSAKWYHAGIRHADGTQLSDEEHDEVLVLGR